MFNFKKQDDKLDERTHNNYNDPDCRDFYVTLPQDGSPFSYRHSNKTP